MTDKITIDLGDNLKLSVQKNVSPYDKEILVYIEDDKDSLQDLAVISPDYDIKKMITSSITMKDLT